MIYFRKGLILFIDEAAGAKWQWNRILKAGFVKKHMAIILGRRLFADGSWLWQWSYEWRGHDGHNNGHAHVAERDLLTRPEIPFQLFYTTPEQRAISDAGEFASFS